MFLIPYVVLCVIKIYETEIEFYGLSATHIFRVQPKKKDSHYANDIKKERGQNSVTHAISVPCLWKSRKVWKCSSKWVLIHVRPRDLAIRDPRLLQFFITSLINREHQGLRHAGRHKRCKANTSSRAHGRGDGPSSPCSYASSPPCAPLSFASNRGTTHSSRVRHRRRGHICRPRTSHSSRVSRTNRHPSRSLGGCARSGRRRGRSVARDP